MKNMKRTLSTILCSLLVSPAFAASSIAGSCQFFNSSNAFGSPLPLKNYQVKFQYCQMGSKDGIGLREFTSSGRTYVLLADPDSLATTLVDRSCLDCHDLSVNDIPSSNYRSVLRGQIRPPFPFSNKGLVHAHPGIKGYFLSVDMCPSHKSFETSLFQNPRLLSKGHFPLAISISGGWMKHHKAELAWLKSQEQNGRFDITWVNHSYTHPYDHSLPPNVNFLLLPRTNFADEVFKQEQYMISNGLTPSVYFRFPGLISDEQLIEDLTSYGLVSLGADAWLALGEKPTPGSVILIHGNGNEPPGIHLFLKFLDKITNLDQFKALSELF